MSVDPNIHPPIEGDNPLEGEEIELTIRTAGDAMARKLKSIARRFDDKLVQVDEDEAAVLRKLADDWKMAKKEA